VLHLRTRRKGLHRGRKRENHTNVVCLRIFNKMRLTKTSLYDNDRGRGGRPRGEETSKKAEKMRGKERISLQGIGRASETNKRIGKKETLFRDQERDHEGDRKIEFADEENGPKQKPPIRFERARRIRHKRKKGGGEESQRLTLQGRKKGGYY